MQITLSDDSSIEVSDVWQHLDANPSDPPSLQPLGFESEGTSAIVTIAQIPHSAAIPMKVDDVVWGSAQFLDPTMGIVEAGGAADGRGVSYVILKRGMEPAGVEYALTAHVFGEAITQVQGVFSESGMTGLRDTVVFEQAQRDGILAFAPTGLQGWTTDLFGVGGILPNLSEDSAYDAMFPDHPLSHARALVAALIERRNVARSADTDGGNEGLGSARWAEIQTRGEGHVLGLDEVPAEGEGVAAEGGDVGI